jgi:hypothetical protein
MKLSNTKISNFLNDCKSLYFFETILNLNVKILFLQLYLFVCGNIILSPVKI